MLELFNRQRLQRLNLARIQALTERLLAGPLKVPDALLGIHFVGPAEMARVNQAFLNHEGSTDVITFDHRDTFPLGETPSSGIHGELYICIREAVDQGSEFGRHWTEELIRYIIHGILHLKGYNDVTPADRRRMKAVENRLVRQANTLANLRKLGDPPSRRRSRRARGL